MTSAWGAGNDVPASWKANRGCPPAGSPTREPWYPPTRRWLSLRRHREIMRALARVTTSVRREIR